MNKSFRLIYNTIRQTWVAVSETARGRGKRRSGALLLASGLLAAMAPALAATALPPAANQLPSGGQVVAGQASITQSGSTLTVNQTSNRAALDWQRFDVGVSATVKFQQPSSSSVTLNRVLDANPSQIFGRISANGQVFLSNPNGVYFAPGASVDVGALVATTHRIGLDDFMAGGSTFARAGATGSVINEGELRAALGGYIALLAPQVRNSGIIVAQAGTVALAAGEAITLRIENGSTLAGITVQPGLLQALVDNRAAVLAPGGLIILSAQAAAALQGGVIQNSGALEAGGLVNDGGRIVLEASDRISHSGSIKVDGVGTGSGGTVSLIASLAQGDSLGTLDGSIRARGGSLGGHGGFVETSASHLAIGPQFSVDTSAPAGTTGHWLIDPLDFRIAASGGDITGAALGSLLASNSISIQTALAPTATPTNLNGSTGSNGDILVDDAVSWNAATSLTLDAYRDIRVNANLTALAAGANIDLKAANSITQAQSVVLTTTGGNITFHSDSDASQSGAIVLKNNTQVITHGGNIVMGGGADPLSGAAWGTATNQDGIVLFDTVTPWNGLPAARLNAGGGNIQLMGHGALGGHGISSNVAVTMQTSGSGSISLNGTGNAGGYGVVIDRTTLQTVDGAITVRATAGASGPYALSQQAGPGGVVASGSGDIRYTAIGGLVQFADSSLGDASATGNVLLQADAIRSRNFSINTSGSLTVEPWASSFSSPVDLGVLGLGSRVSALTLGKSGNATDILLDTAIHMDGRVALYGGNIVINAPLYAGTSLALNYGQGGLASGNTASYSINAQVSLSAGPHFSTQLGTDGATQVYTVITSLGTQADAVTAPASMTLQGLAATASLAGNYVLGADIDAAATAGWNSNGAATPVYAGFAPIGSIARNFTGTFDGLGHTISHAVIYRPASAYVGLFGVTSASAKIRDLGVVDGSVTASSYTGGLVGRNSGAISNSFSSNRASGPSYVGGLVGYNMGGSIRNSYAQGSVFGSNSGGLVGRNEGSVDGSYASGRVSGGGGGGLLGLNNGGSVSNSFWDVISSGKSTSPGSSSGNTTTELLSQQTYLDSGWNLDSTWYMVDGYTRPILRMELSSSISSAHQLQLMGSALAGHYTLAGNLDLAAELANPAGMWGTASNTAATGISSGFAPVGNYDANFSGSLDGLSHTISNLRIDRSLDGSGNVGLFGMVNGAAVIRNIGLLNASITGQASVGALVGTNQGSISNSYASGSVAGTENVGGLVGNNMYGSISDSYATAAVTASVNYAGGLVGLNQSARISNSYASGSVTASGDQGGLVGGVDDGSDISASFWDSNSSGQPVGVGGDGASQYGVSGLATADMQLASNFAAAGWSPAVWGMQNGVNNGYAVLKSFYADASLVTSIYLRLLAGGSSVSGTTPDLAYAYYSASSGGSLVGNADPNGSVSWTGAPTATSAAGLYSLRYASGITLGNSIYALVPGAAVDWNVTPRPPVVPPVIPPVIPPAPPSPTPTPAPTLLPAVDAPVLPLLPAAPPVAPALAGGSRPDAPAGPPAIGGLPMAAAPALAQNFRGSSADSGGVTVRLNQAPSGAGNGWLTVSVPAGTANAGAAFAFALPALLLQAAPDAAIEVRTAAGAALPAWLWFEAAGRRILATAVPPGGLPLELLVSVDGQTSRVTIAERLE